MTGEELSELAACPSCGADLELPASGADARCERCGARYGRLAFAWDLTPPPEMRTSTMWATWEQLQANGEVSYEADPENNLGVGDRPDFGLFSRFADLEGRVLDVGCGPQPWPAHFSMHAERCRFVGIDPLVGERRADYTQVRGLAEHLPFRAGAFDQVVFATTLDHFVDPTAALREAARVLRPAGTIEVWLGHKSPDAPRPATSPEWYRQLSEPDGADDLFHIKRLDDGDTRDLVAAAGLAVAAEETHQVDRYRANHFYKLSIGA